MVIGMPEPNVIGTFAERRHCLICCADGRPSSDCQTKRLNVCAASPAALWTNTCGAAPEEGATTLTLALLMHGLGLSGQLVVDAAKAAPVSKLWATEGKRSSKAAHPPDRLSKVALTRARPVVLGELASKAAAARWKRTTSKMRPESIARMNDAHLAQRRTCASR
jgi:hypothetical protein